MGEKPSEYLLELHFLSCHLYKFESTYEPDGNGFVDTIEMLSIF